MQVNSASVPDNWWPYQLPSPAVEAARTISWCPGACRSAAASPARTLAVKRSPWRRIAGWGDHRVIYGWVTNANGGRFLRPAPAVRVSLANRPEGSWVDLGNIQG